MVWVRFLGSGMRSCGVHRRGSGGTFALGRPVFAAMRLRYGGWDCCEPKRKKLRGEHEGIRIGPLTGHMGRGRTSMTNTRRAKARRCFRNRRFRYVTRAAGRGQGYRPKCVSVLSCVPLWRWAFLLFELYGRGTRGRPECVSGMAGQALRHNG